MRKSILALILISSISPCAFAKKHAAPAPSGPGPGEEAIVCVTVNEYPTGKIPGGLQYAHPFTEIERNANCPGIIVVNLTVVDTDGTVLTDPNQGNNPYALGPPGFFYKDSGVPCEGCRTGMGPNGDGPAADRFTITWPSGFHKLTVYACADPAMPTGPAHSCVVPN